MMNFPPSPITVFWLLTAHCAIGLVGAIVAWRKGYSLPWWVLFGLLGGTPIFIAVLLLGEKKGKI